MNVFEEDFNQSYGESNESNKKRTNHRKSSLKTKKTLKTKKSSLSSSMTSDDGICLTSDSHKSYKPFNESIAQRIKNRNNPKIRDNSKQFDSGLFIERVVDQIADKVVIYLF